MFHNRLSYIYIYSIYLHIQYTIIIYTFTVNSIFFLFLNQRLSKLYQITTKRLFKNVWNFQ